MFLLLTLPNEYLNSQICTYIFVAVLPQNLYDVRTCSFCLRCESNTNACTYVSNTIPQLYTHSVSHVHTTNKNYQLRYFKIGK